MSVLNDILNDLPDTYYKGEGEFVYDIVAAIALVLEKQNIEASEILDKGFASTATGSDLDKICYDHGIERKLAQSSSGIVKITGVAGASVKIGDLVSSDNVNFLIQENKSILQGLNSMEVYVSCQDKGTIGNVPIGAIKYFPVSIQGLSGVTNETQFRNGANIENDEQLRQRYYNKVRTPGTSGNKAHYINWATEVIGVGGARIFPLWNGNGTVKVVIINSEGKGADQLIINSVANNIENQRPIGATVTVKSAKEKLINIDVILTIDQINMTVEEVKKNIETNITNYLKSIAFKEDYVSYAKIGSIILATQGVIDYSNLKINNGISNVQIASEEVAIIGGVTIA